MPMESKSTSSDKPTKGTSMIQQLHLYDLTLKLFACLQKLWQGRPHPLAYIQRQWHTFALVILYIFFRPTFEKHIAPLFAQFDPSPVSTYIWFGLIIATICYTIILIRRRYVFSEGGGLWALVTLLGWWYYRFKGIPNYEVTKIPAEWTPQYISNIDLLYIDLLLVIGGCIIVVQVFSWARPLGSYLYRPWKRKQANRDAGIEGFTPDYPASPEDTDLLGRSEKAFDLAKKIFHTDTSKAAFTLGLTAPWGAGKTSFMLAMQQYLRDNHCSEIILIEFNPWMYRKAPNLTQIFFEELSRALAPYSSALASGFMQYVDYILSKENNTWIQLGARLLPQGFKAKSTSEQYEFLNKEIGKLGKKIIIFIDDVDRLDSEELTELFCLVRNISPFPNMSYILAYDKEYVATQLQKKFDKHTYRYMEKIVQAEYPLAKITPKQLEQAITDIFYSMGNKYIALKEYLDSSHLQLVHHLPSLRSIKHIHNCLLSLPNELQEKVRLFDWFIIELLRIQYPRLFEFLKENYVRAFDCDANWRVIMEIGEDSDHSHSHSALMFDHQTYGEIIHFREYLSLHREELQIENIDLALELMIKLWGKSREVADGQANSWNYIERYLYRTISDSSIVKYHKSITPSLRQPIQLEMVRFYIEQESCDYNGFSTLLYRLLEENPIGREETTYMLYVAFCALSTDQFFKYFSLSGANMFIIQNDESDARYMKDRIDSWINSITRLLNEEHLRAVLYHPDVRRGVLRYLSWAINCEIGINIPFNLETLEAAKEELFLLYLKQNQASPIDYYRLWFQCQTRIKVTPDGSHEITDEPIARLPKMDNAIRAVIRNNIEVLIPCFIQKQVGIKYPRYKILLPNLIFTLDENKKSPEVIYFPDLIRSLDGSSSSNIGEFLEFFNLWKKDDSDFIHFEFKHIIPANLEKEECQ